MSKTEFTATKAPVQGEHRGCKQGAKPYGSGRSNKDPISQAMAREKRHRSRVHRSLRREPYDSLRNVPKESRLVRPGKGTVSCR
jgi:hypothetical protein